MTTCERLLESWGLRFTDETEEEDFADTFSRSWRRVHQVAICLGTVIYYAFFIWDKIIDPDPARHDLTHAIRGLVTPPLFLMTALALNFRRLDRYSETIVIAGPMVGAVALTAIYAILHRGFEYGGVGIVLVVFLTFSMLRVRFAHYTVFSALTLVSFNVGMVFFSDVALGHIVVNNMVVVTAIALGLFSAVVREHGARREFRISRELSASRARIEELLFSMLPDDIVRRIQSGEKTIADSYGEVSIVFADLVGFTALARRIAPNHLVEILNRLFSAFDALATEHGVEKIKTIGDAYMAVAGVGDRREGHADRAADFALAIRRAARDIAAELSFDIKLRIGIHVGPIVAGVIGSSRPAFDCWGDSVNIASRMESTAGTGIIQISEPTYWRLRQNYLIEQREDVDLKGVGATSSYVLVEKLV